MLEVPTSLAHFHARRRPAAHKHAHRQHTLQGEGSQAGGWGVGVPDCNFFEGARRTFSARPCSELGAFSSKSASSYQPAGRRQAATSGWVPQEQPEAPAGGEPGSEGTAGTGRVRGKARAVRSLPVLALLPPQRPKCRAPRTSRPAFPSAFTSRKTVFPQPSLRQNRPIFGRGQPSSGKILIGGGRGNP